MKTMWYDVIPNMGRRQKSFYGKAKVAEHYNSNGIMTSRTLYSYDTPICTLYSGGKLEKKWNGWSMTTEKHINSFLRNCGLPAMSKKEWERLPVGICKDYSVNSFSRE